MQLTPEGLQLIHDLRHDAHTREHFSIVNWGGKNTCPTVGCIGGTLILRHYGRLEQVGDPVEKGARILGVSREVAGELFLPPTWIAEVLCSWPFPHLGNNERPSLQTIQEMQEWARHEAGATLLRIPSLAFMVNMGYFHPDACANAMERLQEHETYVDWAEAHRLCDA